MKVEILTWLPLVNLVIMLAASIAVVTITRENLKRLESLIGDIQERHDRVVREIRKDHDEILKIVAALDNRLTRQETICVLRREAEEPGCR
jgi:hypothetical protein